MTHRAAPVFAVSTSRPLLALLVPLALVLTGCSGGSTTGGSASSTSSSSPASTDSEHSEHETGGADSADHDADHGDHAADPSAVLLRTRDLPAGYVSGHAHLTPPTGDEPTPAACRPLAELLRPATGQHGADDGAGHGADDGADDGTDDGADGGAATTHGDHEAAAVSFTKSHFGPTISHTVVDLGGFDQAAAEVRRIEEAATACPTYVHSTSRIGAGRYTVAPLEAPADAEPGAYLRLTATGKDFGPDLIRWDVWVHDCEGKLVAVTFRSARGGDNADFWPAVSAAMDRIHDA